MISSRVLLFHKPKGVTVTRVDEKGRRTVYDVLPAWVREEGWVPIGRLDRETRGLLLFVKEGALVEALGRPGLRRVYEAQVRGHVQEAHREQMLRGVSTAVGLLSCAEILILGYAGPKTRARLTLTEGRNRHVRRLFGALRDEAAGTSLKVLDLKRVSYGPIVLDVPSGAWRGLAPAEVAALLGSSGD